MLTGAAAFALTAAGLAVAGLRAYRRRVLSATRWFAVALLPAGLYLTGLFPVARTIGSEIAGWATKLVFDPRVWAGIVLLAVSAALLVSTRWIARRRLDDAQAGPAATAAAPARPAVTGAAAAPRSRPAEQPDAKRSNAKQPDDGLGDFSDIEEILRKRGI